MLNRLIRQIESSLNAAMDFILSRNNSRSDRLSENRRESKITAALGRYFSANRRLSMGHNQVDLK